MATNRRPDRVAEGIREEIAIFLQENGVGDPRVQGLVTVTGVESARDLRSARVFVSYLGDEEGRQHVLEALTALVPRLRGHVGRALRLRVAPELHFRLDDSVARAARIEDLLRQIREGEGPTGALPDGSPPGGDAGAARARPAADDEDDDDSAD